MPKCGMRSADRRRACFLELMMPLHFVATNTDGRSAYEHASGPLEIGRGPQRDQPRWVIGGDQSVSRDQVRVEELPAGRVRLGNLSSTTRVALADGTAIDPQQSRDFDLPVAITIGRTQIEISLPATAATSASAPRAVPPTVTPTATRAVPPTVPPTATRAVPPTPTRPLATPHPSTPVAVDSSNRFRSIPQTTPAGAEAEASRSSPSPAGAAAGIGPWLERIIQLQQAGSDTREFHDTAAKALVDLVGMELGLVILRSANGWSIGGCAVTSDRTTVRYSKTLVDRVAAEGKTFFDDFDQMAGSTASLMDVESGVASPILGVSGDVIGVLYGVRTTMGLATRGPITPLEAQLVQLLAASVGATMARSMAQRTQVQFEQFFTRELSQQLSLHPDLLEGRDAEVSILFCDIRGFSRISERLGPRGTVQWIGNVMEVLSDCVLAHSGVLVDYIGDELIAMWGAPVPQPEHGTLASRAAIDMLCAVPLLNERWSETLGESMDLGIGINSGIARVGNTGSRHKFKYGPLGNTVNLASRVQGATKYLRSTILITGSTRSHLTTGFDIRRLCQVRVVNINEPVELHQLGIPNQPGWSDLQQGYEAALGAFEARDFRLAAHIVSGLLEKWPDDGPSLLLLSRAANSLVADSDDFTPVWELPGK